MDLQPCRLEAVKEEDVGQIATRRTDGWRIPFGSISWSYFTPTKLRSAKSRLYNGSLFLRLTPSDASSSSNRDQLDPCNDVTLNPDLCGVRGATEAVRVYEANVGFHCSAFPDLHLNGSSPDISVEVDEGNVRRGKDEWDVLVENLGGIGLHESASYEEFGSGNESGESSPSSSLHRSTSTLSSIDSDLSTDSISFPSTPKAKDFETMVIIKGDSPNSSTYSPVRPLNASASSFVPSFIKPKVEPISFPTLSSYPSPSSSPSPPPMFVNFTFPTLDVPPLPVVKIKKDEQGFYSEVKSPAPSQRPSIDLLPPFLQERRKAPASKTRAMVERLRSYNYSEDSVETAIVESKSASHCPSPSPPFHDLTFPQEQSTISEAGHDHADGMLDPSLDEDDDGWINLSGMKSGSPESKAQRTRDLFLALTRRRSDSLPAIGTADSEGTGGETKETISTAVSTPFLSPALPSGDGWLEGSAVSQKPQASLDIKPTAPRARTDSRPRSRVSRKRRSSNHNAPVPPHPTIPHHFMAPINTIPRPPLSAGMHHPAGSISFPVQQPPAPFFPPPYPHMMVPMPPYGPYMLQMQMQAQTQMHGHRATASTGGEWFPYPQGGQPFMNPHASIATNMNMINAPTRRGSVW